MCMHGTFPSDYPDFALRKVDCFNLLFRLSYPYLYEWPNVHLELQIKKLKREQSVMLHHAVNCDCKVFTYSRTTIFCYSLRGLSMEYGLVRGHGRWNAIRFFYVSFSMSQLTSQFSSTVPRVLHRPLV